MRSTSGRTIALPVRYDWTFLLLAGLLIGFGLLAVATTSVTLSEQQFHDPLHFFWHQIYVLVGALGIAALVQFIPSKYWQPFGRACLVVALLLMVVVLLPGVAQAVNGSRRWIRLGSITIQGSEIAKMLMVIYLADYLARHRSILRQGLSSLVSPLLAVMLLVILAVIEPDYGTAVVLCVAAGSLLLLSPVPFPSLFALFGVTTVVMTSVASLASYRVARLKSFLDPWQDPLDSGFQLTQALIAYGRGHWFGSGLGRSVQKLFYLPEAHTDFSFAVLAEELGLFGSSAIILLFWLFIIKGFSIARAAEREERYFSAYVSYGFTLVIGFEAFLHIGVNMGLLPTKGLPLPFFSYGGSALFVKVVMLAMLARLSAENQKQRMPLRAT